MKETDSNSNEGMGPYSPPGGHISSLDKNEVVNGVSTVYLNGCPYSKEDFALVEVLKEYSDWDAEAEYLLLRTFVEKVYDDGFITGGTPEDNYLDADTPDDIMTKCYQAIELLKKLDAYFDGIGRVNPHKVDFSFDNIFSN